MNGATTIAAACAEAGLRVERDVSSRAFTTYRCGGAFSTLVRAGSLDDLQRLAATIDGSDVPVLVVGAGSNLLVADAGFDGVAVALDGEFRSLLAVEDTHVRAGGAVALPVLARQAGTAGVANLEFYVGIPGSVGGAVRMNAGGHGRDTAAVLVRTRLFDLGSGAIHERAVDDLALGYRTSNVTNRQVVCDATFAGVRDDPDACAARIAEIVAWRREHQPGGQNAGSVFTNPPDDAAGRLIEASGCKGLRIGGAVVSEKHANFFVAGEGATATDVHDLIIEVQRRVAEATGVHLHPELHLVGFDTATRRPR